MTNQEQPHIKQRFGIFLSSTNDPEVRKYRLAARAIIESDEFQEKWYVVEMDQFTPSGITSVEECRKRVISCSVYIGILGPFFGTIEEKTQKSYTEIEYDVAFEAKREIGVFLLPDDILLSTPPEILIKQGNLFQRQISFKQRVNSFHTTRSVTNLDDFKSHLTRYLRELHVFAPKNVDISEEEQVLPGDLSYDRQPVTEYWWTDWNSKTIKDFLAMPQSKLALDRLELLEASPEEHMHILGLLDHKGRLTLGSFLCFAPMVQLADSMSACGLHMVVYDGFDKATAKTIYIEEAEDNLVNLHKIGMRFFRTNAGLKRIGNIGSEDRDELEIPTIALREGLANALIHRDYADQLLREQPTRIEVYADRIEIISFGSLLPGISEAALNSDPTSIQSIRRNPIIAKIFMYFQLVELGGSGISRMHDAMNKQHLLPPEISQNSDQLMIVKLVLHRPVLSTLESRGSELFEAIPNLSDIQNDNTDKNRTKIKDPQIFLSYRSTDADVALRIGLDLKKLGFRIWVDRLDIRPGQDWLRTLQEAVDDSDAMIVLLSPEYILSRYAQRELARMDRLGKPIVPILIKPIASHDWPLEVERQQYIDMSDFKNPTIYNKALQALSNLLRTLYYRK